MTEDRREGPRAGPRAGEPVCVPKAHAFDFARFCLLNPRPCPLLAIAATPADLSPMQSRSHLARDLPRYRVWRDGVVAEDVNDASHVWTGDELTGFLLGCSLAGAGPRTRAGTAAARRRCATNVAMYVTNVENAASGPDGGFLVVSRGTRTTRTLPEARVGRRGADGGVPAAHGVPVHWGARGAGHRRPVRAGLRRRRPPWPREVPVFWACGVTPQSALAEAALPLCVTHAPGHMFVCDLVDEALHGWCAQVTNVTRGRRPRDAIRGVDREACALGVAAKAYSVKDGKRRTLMIAARRRRPSTKTARAGRRFFRRCRRRLRTRSSRRGANRESSRAAATRRPRRRGVAAAMRRRPPRPRELRRRAAADRRRRGGRASWRRPTPTAGCALRRRRVETAAARSAPRARRRGRAHREARVAPAELPRRRDRRRTCCARCSGARARAVAPFELRVGEPAELGARPRPLPARRRTEHAAVGQEPRKLRRVAAPLARPGVPICSNASTTSGLVDSLRRHRRASSGTDRFKDDWTGEARSDRSWAGRRKALRAGRAARRAPASTSTTFTATAAAKAGEGGPTAS